MIFVLIGPSGSGKDTLLSKTLSRNNNIKQVAVCTSRPMRDGEVEGRTYNFIDADQFSDDNFVARRTYDTVYGVWQYGIRKADFQQLDEKNDYIVIQTPSGYKELAALRKDVVPVIVHVPFMTRASRLIARDKLSTDKDAMREFNRRMSTDAADFSNENMKDITAAGYTVENIELETALRQLSDIIESRGTASKEK